MIPFWSQTSVLRVHFSEAPEPAGIPCWKLFTCFQMASPPNLSSRDGVLYLALYSLTAGWETVLSACPPALHPFFPQSLPFPPASLVSPWEKRRDSLDLRCSSPCWSPRLTPTLEACGPFLGLSVAHLPSQLTPHLWVEHLWEHHRSSLVSGVTSQMRVLGVHWKD